MQFSSYGGNLPQSNASVGAHLPESPFRLSRDRDAGSEPQQILRSTLQGTSSGSLSSQGVDTLHRAHRPPHVRRVTPRFGAASAKAASSAQESSFEWTLPEAKALAETVYHQELQDQYTIWSYENLETWWALHELETSLQDWIQARTTDDGNTKGNTKQSEARQTQLKVVQTRWLPQVIQARQAQEETLASVGWDMSTVNHLLEPDGWDAQTWKVEDYLLGGKNENRPVDKVAPKEFQEAVWRERILAHTIETTLSQDSSATMDTDTWIHQVLDQAPVSVMDVMERVKARAHQKPWLQAPVYDDDSMPFMSETAVFNAIADGEPFPTQGHYWVGIVQVGEGGHLTVKTHDEPLKNLVNVWDETFSAEAKAQIPASGVPVSVLSQGGIKAHKEPTTLQEARSYVPFTQEEEHTNLLFEFINGPLADVYGEESVWLRGIEEESAEEEAGFFQTLFKPVVWLKNALGAFMGGGIRWIRDQVARLRGQSTRAEAELLEKPDHTGEEVILWPFLKHVIEGQGETLPQVAQELYQDLSRLPLAQVAVGSIGEETPEDLLTEVETASESIQKRLAAFELAKHYFFDSGHEKQVYLSMLIGMGAGLGGETAVEHMVGEDPSHGTAMRTGLLYGIDLIDNFFGQAGIVMSRVKGGQPLAPELTRAAGAAFGGGTMGLLAAPGKAYALSNSSVPVGIRAALGGFGSLGTAMAVPINVVSAFYEKKAVVERLLKARIIQPTAAELQEYGSMDNRGNLQQLARSYALNELLTEVGTAASIKAFFGVPFASASLLMTEKLGLSERMARRLYMTGAAGMENILTGGLMFAKERRLHSVMESFETHLIDQAAKGKAPDPELMEKTFGDPMARWSAENLLLSPVGPALGVAGLAGMYGYVAWHKNQSQHQDVAHTGGLSSSHGSFQDAPVLGTSAIHQPQGQYGGIDGINSSHQPQYGALFGGMGTPHLRSPNGMNVALLSNPHRFFAHAHTQSQGMSHQRRTRH